VLVQLVEIPGLIEGASEGRGGARPLLGVLRGADAILFCHDASAPVEELRAVMAEVAEAEIERPAVIAATKSDEADGAALRAAFPELRVVEVSVLDDASIEQLREIIWQLTGLMRVYLRDDQHPMSLIRSTTTSAHAARERGSGDPQRASRVNRSGAGTSSRTVTP